MAFGHFFWPGPKGQRPERPRKGKLQFGSATRLRLLTIAWVPDPQARDSRIPTSCLSVLVSEEAARVCALHDIGHTLIVRAYVHSWSRWVAGGWWLVAPFGVSTTPFELSLIRPFVVSICVNVSKCQTPQQKIHYELSIPTRSVFTGSAASPEARITRLQNRHITSYLSHFQVCEARAHRASNIQQRLASCIVLAGRKVVDCSTQGP